jgi:MFS family permease
MSDVASETLASKSPHAVLALLPLMTVVLVVFLVTGFAIPVLPLHVHSGLGFRPLVVGLVSGSQFAASLISRVWAGHIADSRGAKSAVIAGLCAAAASGLFYALSIAATRVPSVSVVILLFGHAVLGVAESFIITGAVTWGLTLVGAESAGRVIAWMGMAMFAALAVGAPIGTALYSAGGLATVASATALVPLSTLVLIAPLPGVAARPGVRPSLAKVIAAVWMPGVASALSSIGLGAILTFSALISLEQHWNPVWLLFTSFAVTLVLARLFLGHAPDRFGGAPVALVCVLVEVVGLALIWLAHGHAVAAIVDWSRSSSPARWR